MRARRVRELVCMLVLGGRSSLREGGSRIQALRVCGRRGGRCLYVGVALAPSTRSCVGLGGARLAA